MKGSGSGVRNGEKRGGGGGKQQCMEKKKTGETVGDSLGGERWGGGQAWGHPRGDGKIGETGGGEGWQVILG